jgi:hypothetical protein
MKLMAVLALACGLAAAPLTVAGAASADPASCDGPDCALYVKKNIVPTDFCQFQSRNPFGLDAKGSTYACNASNEWVPVAPLIGVRTLRAPCDPNVPGVAVSPQGAPLTCKGGAWSTYYDVFYYG